LKSIFVPAFRLGAVAAAHQKGLDVIGGHDVTPAPCRGERRIAVAGRDIEHFLAGAQIERFAQRFTDDLQGRSNDRIIARGPCRLLTGLYGGEVRRAGS
jgi:hypothetical protein